MTTHGPAESDPGQRDSPGAFQALRCPFCHEAADEGATACDGCGARLHPGCWQEADGRCSSCGRRSAVPAARLSPRQRVAAIPAVCLAALAALALVIGSAALVVRENARNKDVALRQRACAALSDDLEWITVIESAPGTPASPHRQLWQIEVHTERRALSAEGALRSVTGTLVESVEVRACGGMDCSAEAPPLVVGVRLAPSAQGCSLDVCIGDLSSMGKAKCSLPGETFVSASGAAAIAGPGPFRCIETRDGAVLYRHTLVLVQRESEASE